MEKLDPHKLSFKCPGLEAGASLWSLYTSFASSEWLSNESLTFVIFLGQRETIEQEYQLKLFHLDISGQ